MFKQHGYFRLQGAYTFPSKLRLLQKEARIELVKSYKSFKCFEGYKLGTK